LKASVHEIAQSAAFRRLVAERWRVSLLLLVCLFTIYYGYILVVGVNKPLLARRIGDGATTLGIPLGAAVIVGAWLLTAAYVVWANRRYDAEVRRLRAQLQD
jgi:uncharacterized membrane protein (DUF485 family)